MGGEIAIRRVAKLRDKRSLLTDGSSRGVPLGLLDLSLQVSQRDGKLVVDFLSQMQVHSISLPQIAS